MREAISQALQECPSEFTTIDPVTDTLDIDYGEIARIVDEAVVSPRLAEQEQARVALADALGEARGHTMAHLIDRARAWRYRADELATQPDRACGTEERQT
jgi:hypothetical protein